MRRTGAGRRWLRQGLCGLLLALGMGASVAATVNDQVTVVLAGGDAEAREQAKAQALGQMLQRLAGRPLPAVSRALASRVDRYVTATAVRQEQGRELLAVNFDAGALRTRLVERGESVWLSERPPVLIWAAVSDKGARRLVGGDGALAPDLRGAAAAYGVPTLLPVLDLTDREAVRYADIAGGFSDVVAEATRRYGTPLALMLSLTRQGEGWDARWTLVDDGRAVASGDVGAASSAPLLERVWGEVVARLRREYAALPDAGAVGIQVTVSGLDDLAALAAAERRLAGSVGVTGVRLEALEAGRGRFRVDAEVGPARLQTVLDRAPQWQRDSAAAAGLHYRWLGGGGSR